MSEYFLAAGASGTAEIGVAVSPGSNGQIVGFASGCYGMKTDVSIGGGVVFGVWKSLDSVPGKSYLGLLKWSRGNAVVVSICA